MTRILLFNSSVAHGHVGACAQVFPLERLGAEVALVATVRFSNHPGYGSFRGEISAPAEITALTEGMEAIGALDGLDGVLSGYLGSAETADAVLAAVLRARAQSPGALYACDPVIGDHGRVYVRPGIAEILAAKALPMADLVTPNPFELGLLSGTPIADVAAARKAAMLLAARLRPGGPRLVLATGLALAETPAAAIECLLADGETCFRVRTPKLPLAASGAGDLAAALFLLEFLRTRNGPAALSAMVARLFAVLEATGAARELALVAAQDGLAAPRRNFPAEPC